MSFHEETLLRARSFSRGATRPPSASLSTPKVRRPHAHAAADRKRPARLQAPVEVKIKGGAPNKWRWAACVLNNDSYGGRTYMMLDGPSSSVFVPHAEIRERVRPVGGPSHRARLFCYLCGREAGLASFSFHLQKCILFFDARVALPTRATLELVDPRSLPEGPGSDLDEYNLRARQVHDEFVKPKCPRCAKTFAPVALVAHVKECLKDRPRVVAEIISRFGPKGYRPFGERLIGGAATRSPMHSFCHPTTQGGKFNVERPSRHKTWEPKNNDYRAKPHLTVPKPGKLVHRSSTE